MRSANQRTLQSICVCWPRRFYLLTISEFIFTYYMAWVYVTVYRMILYARADKPQTKRPGSDLYDVKRPVSETPPATTYWLNLLTGHICEILITITQGCVWKYMVG